MFPTWKHLYPTWKHNFHNYPDSFSNQAGFFFCKGLQQKNAIYFVLRSTFRTFAAMNAKTKRLFASRVLLAVFLPMLFFASLHMHPAQSLTGDECTECINHHCGGHIGQQTLSIHDCVLCQMMTLPMIAAAVVTVLLINNVRALRYAPGRCYRYGQQWGTLVTRGPPHLCTNK